MSKKKLLIFTIVLTLLITFVPSTANAANNKVLNQKRMAERQKFRLVKPTKAQIKAVGSELEYYKQLALDDVDSVYFSTSEHKYSSEIKTIIDSYYNSLSDEINSFDSESDLLEGMISFFGMPIPIYKESVMRKLYTLDTLVLLDKAKIKDLSYDEFASDASTALENGFGCYSNYKNLYNTYYGSIIQGDKVSAQKPLENVTDWLSLAEALAQSRILVSNYDELYSFAEYLDTELYCESDDYDDDDYDYDDEEVYLAEELGINTAPSIYIGQRIYTNDEIDVAKEGFKIYIQNYIDRQLETANYPLDDYLTDIRSDVVDEIETSTNVDEIVSLYERTMEQLVKYTGVEYKDYNNARYKRLVKKMEELRKTYTDEATYSEYGIYQNEDLIDRAEQLVDSAYIYKDVEVPANEDLIARLTSLLDETLTYSEELKQLKADYIAELKAYKNNKKYNQSKVVPIVNEGVKKIIAAKTIEDVLDLYDTYYEKAEATIYKFKITTTKVGKGTISKSATIKYGNSYTVKIKPTVGYKISAIYVDGKKVKLTEKYTFKNVTKKHAIKVVFK